MDSGFHVDIDLHPTFVLLRLRGELDLLTASTLRDCLSVALSGRDDPAVVIDVAELTFCDSSGLSALLAAQMVTEASGGRLALSNVAGRLEGMLRITGLEAHFAILPSAREAAAFLG